jgi:hypothetical protein
MRKRSLRLTPTAQKPMQPKFKGRNNEACPHTSGHPDGGSGDRKNGQPNYYLTGAVHGPNNSTADNLQGAPTTLINLTT